MHIHIYRWVYGVLFLFICAAVVGFLHKFTIESDTITYINWDTSVRLENDGSQVPIDANTVSNNSNLAGTYFFSGLLPEGLSRGSLYFEISGANITLYINDEEIYHSLVASSDISSIMHVEIPIPEGCKGTISMDYELVDETGTLFPPILRFVPENLEMIQQYAFANRTALPTGAAALAFVLIFGIFLIGVVMHQTDFSLIPLLLAAAGQTIFQISQSEGLFFLPEYLADILGRHWIGPAVCVALVLYLVMNRKKQFWRQFGIACILSAAALLVLYLISLASDGSLAIYINSSVLALFRSGYYDGIIYWLTWWLNIVCGLIAALNTMSTVVQQRIKSQEISLKNQLLLDSCTSMEHRMKEEAGLRHEYNHNLMALNTLYQKGDMKGLKSLLEQLTQQNDALTQTHFTKNFTVNAIMQDAAMRASKQKTRLLAQIDISEKINMAEQDLCSLLMNILDNALESCQKVEPAEKRQIHLRMITWQGVLVIQCENPYNGERIIKKNGGFASTKQDNTAHGNGTQIMHAIVKKYNGQLDMFAQDGNFIVQTALQLSDKNPPAFS